MRETTTSEWSRRAHALFTNPPRGPIDDAPWLTFVGAFALWSLPMHPLEDSAQLAIPTAFALLSAMPVTWAAARRTSRRRIEIAVGLLTLAAAGATRSVQGAVFTVIVAGMTLLLATLFTMPVIAALHRTAASPTARSRGGEAALLAMYGAVIFAASRWSLVGGGLASHLSQGVERVGITAVLGALTAWLAARGIWWELRARATVRAVQRGDVEGWRADDGVDPAPNVPSLSWLSLGAQGEPAPTPSVLYAERTTRVGEVYRKPVETPVCAVPRRVGAVSAIMALLAMLTVAVGAGFVTALAR